MTAFRLQILLTLFPVLPVLAVDASCKTLLEANQKIYTMPMHLVTTEIRAGKPRTMEIIYLNGKTYMQMNGKWRVSPASPKDMQDVRMKAEAEANVTCSVVREETVDGEATVLYSTHQKTEDGKIDSQVWVSKSRGVPIKTESDSDAGGAAGKVHRTLRYEYTNVQAPI